MIYLSKKVIVNDLTRILGCRVLSLPMKY